MYERQNQLGARFIERDGVSMPGDYGDVRGEYDALQNDAGLIDLAHLGVLRVDGRDHATWLHKLVTANIQGLTDGSGAYSLLLNAKGHVVADFIVLAQSDALWLYTTQSAKQKLYAKLRRAIFREKVILFDVSDSFRVLSLQGARAEAILSQMINWVASPQNPFAVVSIDAMICVRHSRAGADGFDLIVARDHVPSVWDALIANGGRPVGFGALNIARIEAGVAWYGDDFDETMLAPEARLEAFIAENKGCYTGQEVIARIKNRGHVNRLLTQFQIEGEVVPQYGDPIFANGKEVGWVTSAEWSFRHNAPYALGYLRHEVWQDSALVQVLHGESRLSARVTLS